jgi:hypothetical protein
MAIAVYLYVCLVKRKMESAEGLVVWFHLVSWVLPGALVLLATALGKLGYDAEFSSGWCWLEPLSTTRQRLLWHLLEGKIMRENVTFLIQHDVVRYEN